MLKRSLLWIASTTLAMLLPLSANAQMSEQDREARCANNQARVDALTSAINSEIYFLADVELQSLRDDIRTLAKGASFDSAEDETRFAQHLGVPRACLADNACFDQLLSGLKIRLQQGRAAHDRVVAMQAELAQHRTNIVALQCTTPRDNATIPRLSDLCSTVPGTWTWAYAPPGQPPEVHGSVTFTVSGTQSDANGNSGTWRCGGSSLVLNWPGLGKTDNLTLMSGEMTGTNNERWNVRGTR